MGHDHKHSIKQYWEKKCYFLFQCDDMWPFAQDSERYAFCRPSKPTHTRERSQSWQITVNQTNISYHKLKNFRTASSSRTYCNVWSNHKIQRKVIFLQCITPNQEIWNKNV
jgi:hypothetical protein